MELLFTLDEKDYTDDMPVFEKWAVRGIICKNGKYAMQYSSSGKYKIPGGGVEKGETLLQTLAREVREEVGLVVIESSVKEIGEILELREDLKQPGQKYINHSYYYFCDVEDEELEPQMTASEIREGFQLKWATLDEIIDTNNSMTLNKPIMRDTKFLMWLREQVMNKTMRYTAVIEQTYHYKNRMKYIAETNSFIAKDSFSLGYSRNAPQPYGWIKESGTPPQPHLDVFIMTDREFELGDETPVNIIGVFQNCKGDHKLIAVLDDREVTDLSELTREELETLHRLYSGKYEGDAWLGREGAERIIREFWERFK